MTLYYEDPLMDFIHIWPDGRYRSKVFISTDPTPGDNLEVKVTDLEFSLKSQNFCVLVYIAIPSKPFVEFHFCFTCW